MTLDSLPFALQCLYAVLGSFLGYGAGWLLLKTPQWAYKGLKTVIVGIGETGFHTWWYDKALGLKKHPCDECGETVLVHNSQPGVISGVQTYPWLHAKCMKPYEEKHPGVDVWKVDPRINFDGISGALKLIEAHNNNQCGPGCGVCEMEAADRMKARRQLARKRGEGWLCGWCQMTNFLWEDRCAKCAHGRHNEQMGACFGCYTYGPVEKLFDHWWCKKCVGQHEKMKEMGKQRMMREIPMIDIMVGHK